MSMVYIVSNFKELVISLQPDVWLRCSFDQNVAFKVDKWIKLKNENWILLMCDSFPLIMSHMYTILWYVLINFKIFQSCKMYSNKNLWKNKTLQKNFAWFFHQILLPKTKLYPKVTPKKDLIRRKKYAKPLFHLDMYF